MMSLCVHYSYVYEAIYFLGVSERLKVDVEADIVCVTVYCEFGTIKLYCFWLWSFDTLNFWL